MSSFGLYQDQSQGLAYVGLAILLGATIGFEREVEDKPAGLRTHMLVAGAAALFVSVADVMVEQFDVFSAPVGGDVVIKGSPAMSVLAACIHGCPCQDSNRHTDESSSQHRAVWWG